MSKMNPLAKYTKIEVLSAKLISNDVIKYPDGVLGNKGIKVGVCARSARDEIVLNTPDMLMSGDAVSRVIENCCPNVLNADELYINDIEQLLIAIKVATKEYTYDINVKCPECDHEGRIERDLNVLLNTVKYIKEIPTVVLNNGLSIELKPLTWKEQCDINERMFNIQSKSKYLDLDESLSDEDRAKLFISDIFEPITKINFDGIVYSISKIITPDGDEVTEREFISEWVGDQSKDVLKTIQDEINTMQTTGVEHTRQVECRECNHEWVIEDLVYDITRFFDLSFSS